MSLNIARFCYKSNMKRRSLVFSIFIELIGQLFRHLAYSSTDYILEIMKELKLSRLGCWPQTVVNSWLGYPIIDARLYCFGFEQALAALYFFALPLNQLVLHPPKCGLMPLAFWVEDFLIWSSYVHSFTYLSTKAVSERLCHLGSKVCFCPFMPVYLVLPHEAVCLLTITLVCMLLCSGVQIPWGFPNVDSRVCVWTLSTFHGILHIALSTHSTSSSPSPTW